MHRPAHFGAGCVNLLAGVARRGDGFAGELRGEQVRGRTVDFMTQRTRRARSRSLSQCKKSLGIFRSREEERKEGSRRRRFAIRRDRKGRHGVLELHPGLHVCFPRLTGTLRYEIQI